VDFWHWWRAEGHTNLPVETMSTASKTFTVTVTAPPPVGSFIHGTPYTFTATQLGVASFGTKATAAPILFDRVNYSGLSDDDLVPAGGSNPWPRNGFFGRPGVHYNTSDTRRDGSAAQYKGHDEWEGSCLGELTWPKTGTVYVGWWFKPGSDMDAGSHSSKVLRLSDSADIINQTFSWTQMHNYTYPGTTSWQGAATTPNQWTFFEVWFDSVAGIYTCRKNGVAVTNNVTFPNIQFNYLWMIGWDGNTSTAPRLTFWMDDIYVDSSFARVMLGNASTYSACTSLELQPPTAWSSSAITVTANRGAFAATSTRYLYVINSAGTVVNPTGTGIVVN
jgi:hypothetical protein